MVREGPNYLSPEQRAALVRETFEAVATVGFMQWWKSERPEDIERSGYTPRELRQSYVKELEKGFWADFQTMAAKASDDRLYGVLAEWKSAGNSMGLKEWEAQAGQQSWERELDRRAEAAQAAADLFKRQPGEMLTSEGRQEFNGRLAKVRPVTRNLVHAVLLDVWPHQAAVVDFGIDSQKHLEALYYPLRHGEITPQQLDDALGDGKKLTALAQAAPSNPHKEVAFHTSWDAVLGSDRGARAGKSAYQRELDERAKAGGAASNRKTKDQGIER
jgi:hypothetical protein